MRFQKKQTERSFKEPELHQEDLREILQLYSVGNFDLGWGGRRRQGGLEWRTRQ